MTSKLIVNSIRHTGASADAITMDASGNVTFPANATCSGTATGFGGGKVGAFGTHINTSTYTLTSATYQTGVHTVTITPTKTGSTFLIIRGDSCKATAQPDHGVNTIIRIMRAVASASASEIFENIYAHTTYTNGYSGNRIESYGPTANQSIFETGLSYTLGQTVTYSMDVGYQGNTGGVDAIKWNEHQKSYFTVLELTA